MANLLRFDYADAILNDVLVDDQRIVFELELVTGKVALLELRDLGNQRGSEYFISNLARILPRELEDVECYTYGRGTLRRLSMRFSAPPPIAMNFHCREILEDDTRTLDHEDFLSKEPLPEVYVPSNLHTPAPTDHHASFEDQANFLRTAPYPCPRCRGELELSEQHCEQMTRNLGRDFAACPRCEVDIAVAAILHRCQHCSAPLESPNHTIGNSFQCPSCQSNGVVPDSILLSVKDGSVEHSKHFVITCDNCESEQAALQSDVGRRSPCLYCFTDIEIPMVGEFAGESPSLADTTVIHTCPTCGLRVPKMSSPDEGGGSRCPRCGAL